MFPAFLAQYAAGCYLAIGAADIRRSGWRYLRLMAIVSLALAVLAGVFLVREAEASRTAWPRPTIIALAAAAILGAAWLFVNSLQGDAVTGLQRLLPLIAGAACLVGAIYVALGVEAAPADAPMLRTAALAVSGALGAALLGTATAAMLLGHRYLTETEMPIDPLRRLTRIYLGVVAARTLWALIGTAGAWLGGGVPGAGALYFWVALTVRLAVGIVGVGIFAWMVHDCVKRRATQSATALYYLSMLLVVIGELSAQYLMRTEGLAV